MNISLYELNRKFEAAQKKKSVKLKLYEQKLPNLNIEKNIQQKKTKPQGTPRQFEKCNICTTAVSQAKRERKGEKYYMKNIKSS